MGWGQASPHSPPDYGSVTMSSDPFPVEPGRPPSGRVVHAVAEAEGVPPTDLPQIVDAVNPDALNALLASASTQHVEVVFEYCGHTVVVERGGGVTLPNE